MADTEKKYYLHLNGQNVGPLSAAELRMYSITSDTFVWQKGMPQWQQARYFPELAPLFEAVPPAAPYEGSPKAAPGMQPPYGASAYNPSMPSDPAGQRPPMPKSWLVEAILATVFCCLPFGIVSIVYSSKVESAYWAGHYDLAQDYSDKARKWFWASVIGAAAVVALYGLFIAVPLAFSFI